MLTHFCGNINIIYYIQMSFPNNNQSNPEQELWIVTKALNDGQIINIATGQGNQESISFSNGLCTGIGLDYDRACANADWLRMHVLSSPESQGSDDKGPSKSREALRSFGTKAATKAAIGCLKVKSFFSRKRQKSDFEAHFGHN